MSNTDKIKAILSKLGCLDSFEENYRAFHRREPWEDDWSVNTFIYKFNQTSISFHFASTPQGDVYWHDIAFKLYLFVEGMLHAHTKAFMLAMKKAGVYNAVRDYVVWAGIRNGIRKGLLPDEMFEMTILKMASSGMKFDEPIPYRIFAEKLLFEMYYLPRICNNAKPDGYQKLTKHIKRMSRSL